VLQGVRCLALRCNNTELVSGGSDGRICIHDITGDRLGSILQTLQVRRVGWRVHLQVCMGYMTGGAAAAQCTMQCERLRCSKVCSD
jgi:hypothetical protein